MKLFSEIFKSIFFSFMYNSIIKLYQNIGKYGRNNYKLFGEDYEYQNQ
jgi:hypothetical protein